jgi:hypothetical protein
MSEEDQIEITIEQEGSMKLKLSRAEYLAAKEAGELQDFLDVYVSNMEVDTFITEPGQVSFELYS